MTIRERVSPPRAWVVLCTPADTARFGVFFQLSGYWRRDARIYAGSVASGGASRPRYDLQAVKTGSPLARHGLTTEEKARTHTRAESADNLNTFDKLAAMIVTADAWRAAELSEPPAAAPNVGFARQTLGDVFE